MIPVLPPTPVYIDEECKFNPHDTPHNVTPHRIEVVRYIYPTHTMRVKVVCTHCEEYALMMGFDTMKYFEVSFTIQEWISLVDAYYGNIEDRN